MYGWEGRGFDDIARLCARRDPARYPLGAMTTDGKGQALQWFRDLPELSAFLHRMEPQRWGVRMLELVELKARTEPVFVRLDVLGLSEELRAEHNAATAPAFRIDWWGRFEVLTSGDGEFASLLRREFSGAEAPLHPEQQAAFVGFLRERYAPG